MVKIFRPTTFLLLFLQSILSVVAFAQTDRAVLEGSVTDASGGVVIGATVRIVAFETGQTQERNTNASGYYRFPGIARGEYTVSVSDLGFKTKVITEVKLKVGETRTLDVKLEVGALSEKVQVDAPGDLEEQSSAENSAVIGGLEIDSLPLHGRNWATLTRVAPWAQDDGGGD